MDIYFHGSNAPSGGVYNIQSIAPQNLSSGASKIVLTHYSGPDAIPSSHDYNSFSGQVNISYTSTGKVRVVFNNVNARYDNDTTNVYHLSGDITCH